MKREYKLVTEQSKDNFENKLNLLIGQGYKIEGNLSVSGGNIKTFSILVSKQKK